MTGKPSLTPEYRILVAAASVRALDRSRIPVDIVEWSELLRLARLQRMTGLLHRLLEPLGGEIPEAVRAELSSERARIAARELSARRQLHEIASLLSDVDIAAVALKGAALIETTYPEAGLRPMTDLDLLVFPEELERAASALAAAGYRPHPDLSADQLDAYARGGHHHRAPVSHPSRRLGVELHDRLAYWIDEAVTGPLIENAGASRLGPYLLLDANDLVTHLAVHFACDRREVRGAALGQLADIAYALTEQIDWEKLVNRARRLGLAAALFLAARTVSRLELAVVPGDILALLKPASWRPGVGERLLAERVLIEPDRAIGSHVPPSPRQFLLPGPRYMRARYGLSGASLPRLYLERARVAVGMLAPQRIALDRWLDQAVTVRSSAPHRHRSDRPAAG